MDEPTGHIRINPTIAGQFVGGVWGMSPSAHRAMLDTVEASARAGRLLTVETAERLRARDKHRAKGRMLLDGRRSAAPHVIWSMDDAEYDGTTDAHLHPTEAGEPLIGVLPIRGPLVSHGAWCYQGYDDITAAGRALLELGCQTIVLRVDSPGGACAGNPELCAEIRRWRETVDVYAVIDHTGCSAATALATQADWVYVSPSGIFGHAGAWSRWEDATEWMKSKGFRGSYIAEGAYKTFFADDDTEIAPGQQMTMRLAVMAPLVRESYRALVADIAAGRGERMTADAVEKTEAMIYHAAAAVEVGLADGIATFEDVMTVARGGKLPPRATEEAA